MPKPLIVLLAALLAAAALTARPPQTFEPKPRVVATPEDAPPADALVLFDGKDLSAWSTPEGGPAGWVVREGAMEVSGGSIVTRREFGDLQLHLEFMTPANPTGEGQDRGNSGIYFNGCYEVQVLDSFGSDTYIEGQCAAIYEQSPPLVNASREPGKWQVYEIIFRAPRFDDAGKLVQPPSVTVLHNGVLVQDHVAVEAPTRAALFPQHRARGPLYLQDHSHPVRYRNIWVRELDR